MTLEADAIREAKTLPACVACPVCGAPLRRGEYVEHVVGCRALELLSVERALSGIVESRKR